MNPNPFLPAAVIFDMDGVLVDTNTFHIQKWEALLAEHGISFDRHGATETGAGTAQ